MKIIFNLFTIAVMAIAFTACTHDSEIPVSVTDDSPLAVTASMPEDIWSVVSRNGEQSGLSGLEFHYTPAKGTATIATFLVTEYNYNDGSISFTTDKEMSNERLCWKDIKKENFALYLTVVKDGISYWASNLSATCGNDVIRFQLSPRLSRFTVKLNVSANLELHEDDFVFTLSGVKDKASSADPTDQAWPTDKETIEDYVFSVNKIDDAFTATADFAPQTVGNLTIAYKGAILGVIDLSGVTVTSNEGTEKDSYANVLSAGCHITVNASMNMTGLVPGSIQVEVFTTSTGNEHNFNGVITTNQ